MLKNMLNNDINILEMCEKKKCKKLSKFQNNVVLGFQVRRLSLQVIKQSYPNAQRCKYL